MVLDNFAGRVGVVTGAGSGIGRALALRLNELGMRVALVDVDGGGLLETANALPDPEGSATYVTDVADAAAVDDTAQVVISELGVPHLLVNNAGRLGPFDKRSWEISAREWTQVCETNIYGAVNCVRAFLPSMLARAEMGHIVNMSSMAGIVAGPLLAPYRASKFAVRAFSETLERDLAEENSPIGVSVVCPGAVPTNLNQEGRQRRAAAGLPDRTAQAWVDVGDIADHIVDAVRADRFYVFTHPGSEDRLQEYYARVSTSLSA